MSTTTPAGKTMSSRLLTMKFMQRAAASSPTASSPQTPELPSPKRRKTENGSTPTKFDVDALADKRAIQAAIASEEAKRQAALEKQANDAGDTRWVLSFEEQERAANGARKEKPLRVVQIGWGAIDSNRDQVKYEEESEEEEEERPAMVGRRSFGKFNKVVEKTQQNEDSPSEEEEEDEEDEEDEEEDSEEDDLDPEDPTSQFIKVERQAAVSRIKEERKAARKAERKAAVNLARERVKKEVNLNGLSSLSGRQEGPGSSVKCYGCGGPHRKHECPQEQGNRGGEGKRRYEGDHNSSRRKAQRSR